MSANSSPQRTALLVGATGLIGHALLPVLLADPRYRDVHVLLRRATPGLPSSARLRTHVVDFARLADGVAATDDLYCCLGTTIKAAGSEAAFRAVDFELVLACARAALAAGATRLAVVSAMGANANSSIFYNRVKGEMEAAVAALGFDSVCIARPSLLVGDRAALGQPVRAGEVWVRRLTLPLLPLVPRNLRPIEAGRVARAMHFALEAPRAGTRVIESAELNALGG